MAKHKSVFRKIGESITAGGAAVASVAQSAIVASSDLPEGGGYLPVKNQRWAREIKASDAKDLTAKKSRKKKNRRAAEKICKKFKKKRL